MGEYCSYTERLLNKLLSLNEKAKNKVDISEIEKAIYYAKRYHGDQKRQSGEPYYSHPLEVAYMISDYLFRTDILVSSILHDTIEDTELTKEMINKAFGELVATQVDDLTKVKGDKKISSAEMLDLLYKQKKYNVLFIKLFDRLHNMQTLDAKSPEKIKQITEETLKEFIILASYLELPKIKYNFIELYFQPLVLSELWKPYIQGPFEDRHLLAPIPQYGILQKRILKLPEL
ncbi:HD domain-containing protein [Candidatus Tisiphia endosymbiont of Nemotelus uliginosus]|uniref:HD domain-containing protein n=1 Tax=Candidatus Tisiphia endosymbiont of Nemotelus uliginosus TaxID=3077926 RepID=UPI0035C8D78B